MTFPPFSVVVVPFPYSDRLAEKRRPALVISSPELERRHTRLWVAMITSQAGVSAFGDHLISDISVAGLRTASLVRASKLATIDAARVIRAVGMLSHRDKEAVVQQLAACAAF